MPVGAGAGSMPVAPLKELVLGVGASGAAAGHRGRRGRRAGAAGGGGGDWRLLVGAGRGSADSAVVASSGTSGPGGAQYRLGRAMRKYGR
jgi:hypothetical protein